MTNEIEAEISELKKRIRIMENDKKAYEDESNQMLARQAKLIDRLKDENRDFCKTILANSKNKKAMNEAKRSVQDNQAEIRTIKQKIEKEMQVQKQIDEDMKHVQKEIVEKKRNITQAMASDGAANANGVMGAAQIQK